MDEKPKRTKRVDGRVQEVFRLGCPFGSKSDGDLALPSGVRLAVGTLAHIL